MLNTKQLFLATSFIICACNCLAQTKADAGKAAFDSVMLEKKAAKQAMEEVVVTGQYAANPASQAVQKIKVIDRSTIDAMSAQNLKDVLGNQMNIRLSQDNILGSSMSMQGISGENVKFLIDGVPVIGRQNGSVDLSQINLNNIERIEIVEGPMSVNFGTNALAGTINLITKKDIKSNWDLGASTYYETIGTYNLSAKAAYCAKKHTLMLSGGRYFFDGWNDGESIALNNKPTLADARRFQQWKPKLQYFADLQYVYRWGKTTIDFKSSYFQERINNLGMPRAPYGENAIDDKYTTRRIDNAVFTSTQLNKGKSFNAFIAYNDYTRVKNSYYRDLTTLSSELTSGQQDQDTSKFTLLSSRGSFVSGGKDKRFSWEAGYDIGVEKALGQKIENRQQEMGDYAVFTTAEYKPIKSLTIRPGLRLAHNTIYKAPLIPSLNVKYQVNEVLSLRASYAKGFRAPALKELYFYFVDINHNIQGNGSLQAEYSDNYSLSASLIKGIRLSVLKLDGGLYYNNIRNLISLAQINATEYSYRNIGVYKTLGAQAVAEYKSNDVTFSLGAAYTGLYNELSQYVPVDEFSFVPEVRASVIYKIKKPGISLAAFYKYSGKQPGYAVDASNQVVQTSISAFHLADAAVFKTFFKKLTVYVGSKNIFDVKSINNTVAGGAHSSGASIPVSTGRLFFLRMDVGLNMGQL